MSSPPDEEKPRKVPGWRQPWDAWRLLMIAGSLVLLGLALSRTDGNRLPMWLEIGIQMIGFGLLAGGFYLAMRTRREIAAKRLEEEKKVSPRDRG